MLERLARHPWMQVVLVVLVAAMVYLPFLGVRPLDNSEGHRAVPAWTMLERGDFWHQTMFDLTYVRKPPGIAWAIAGSTSWLGESALAARAPSALAAGLMGVLAWWYGRRWFGVGERGTLAGVSAGLAQVLLPLMWSPGRTAEIEMLNNLGTQMLGLGMIDLLLHRPTREHGPEGPFALFAELGASARDVLIPAAGVAVAALAKGPASATVLGGVLIGACVSARSFRPLAARGVWIALLFGGSAAAILLLKFAIANDRPDAVREDVAGQFLWSTSKVWGVAALVPLAWMSALPVSAALLLVCWRPDSAAGPARIARGLAWSWVIAVGLLMAAGVHNPRYAMPAAVLLPALAPWAIRVVRERAGRAGDPGLGLGGMLRQRALSPAVWACAMGLGAWWFVALTSISPTEDQKAGAAAASHFAGLALDKGEVWADDTIEARPDVLWGMRRDAPDRLGVRWAKSQMREGRLPPPGDYLLIRTDPRSGESLRYEAIARTTTLIKLGAARVRDYEFTLYRVRTRTWPLPP